MASTDDAYMDDDEDAFIDDQNADLGLPASRKGKGKGAALLSS